MLHDVKVVTRKTYKCARVEGVPPEEFGISRFAKSMRDCNYCFHYSPSRTEDDLIDAGYDAEQIKRLSSNVGGESLESLARDTVNERTAEGVADAKANRTVATTEHYVRLDYNKDGKAKIYKVVTAGESEEILERDGKPDIEPVDFMPFAAMTPIIMTHRFFGRSIADAVMDIQRIKTSILRGLLDNMYLANNARTEISEAHATKNTIDDLLTNRPGGIVRTKMPGGLNVLQSQSIGPFAYPLMEYMDAMRDWRTGVSKQAVGLDANALQNQSATAANQLFKAAEARLKLIARIFAETGIRDLFSLLHAVIRKNDREQNTVRLRNKWVTVDPRGWKTRNDMTINVGLGSGSKTEQVGILMNILGIQKEAIMQPQGGTLVTLSNIYNTLKRVVTLSGLKSIEPYFTDPSQPQLGPDGQPIQQQPPPDPKMIEMQAKMELEKVQSQADIETQNQKTQAEIALMEKKFQMEQERENRDFMLRQQERQAGPTPFEQAKLALEAHKVQGDLGLRAAAHNKSMLDEQMASIGTAAPGDNPLVAALGQLHNTMATNMGQMSNAVSGLHAGLAQLAAAHAAPAEIVRGPDGKVVGVRKGQAVHQVMRDAAGRVAGVGAATVQ